VPARLREEAPELGGGRGLARALQAGHQDHRWDPVRELQGLRIVTAQQGHHLVADDAQHGLVGAEARQDRSTHSLDADAIQELLDHAEMDVGLEQREANLAERRVDVGFAQGPLATKRPEDSLQLVAQCFEHVEDVPLRSLRSPRRDGGVEGHPSPQSPRRSPRQREILGQAGGHVKS